MIDFATVAPAIRDTITGLAFAGVTPSAGAASPAAVWSRRPKGFTSPDARKDITVAITSIGRIQSRDETRYAYNSGTDTLTASQTGERELSVQVKVESQDDTDALWCWATAENVRSGLARPSVDETLSASGVTFLRTDPIIPIDVRRDGRQLSAAVFTAYFAAALDDTSGESSNFIETIDLTSNVTDPAGTSVASNFADETLP